VSGRVAVGAWIAVLALAALQIARTPFVADLSSFLPAAPTPEQRLLVGELREGSLSRLMLLAVEGGDAPSRARVAQALAAALRSDPAFASVSDGSAAGFERERDFVVAHRYALSPEVTPARFEVEGLREAIGDTIELLASPAGALVKPLVARDPTGETLAVLRALRPASGPARIGGSWASPDGQRALLVARTRASGADLDAQASAVARVQAAFDAARSSDGPGAASERLIMTGPGVFSVLSRSLVKRDIARLSLLGTLAVALLLGSVYRSALALVLGLTPVLSGALVGIAAVSLGFGVVHGITLGFGTTLIGEAVDYSIYLFVQSGRGARAGDASWLAGFWPTIRLGVLTSIAGFSALLLSGLPGLEQLGLYSIAGLATAALVTRFVLPRLLPERFAVRDLAPLGASLETGLGVARRLRPVLAVLALAAVVLLLVRHGEVWDPQLSALNPVPAQEQALDAELRSALGASDARYLVAVRGADIDSALQGAERAGKALDALAAEGHIASYESPARYLPSAATQAARLASLPDERTLRERLDQALAPLPLRPAKLEAFVTDVESARSAPMLTRAALAGTAFEAALDGTLLRGEDGSWIALLGLRAQPGAPFDAAGVRQALGQAGVTQASFLDLREELDRLYGGYLHRALAMSGLGLAAIVLLLAATLRDAGRTARVIIPFVAGAAVVAAAHVLAGTRLNLMHFVGLLLVAAVGSNYALFFDGLGQRERDEARRTLASLVLANATTVASFALLALSTIPVLHAIGSTVAPGAFLTLLFSAAFAAPRPVRAGR